MWIVMASGEDEAKGFDEEARLLRYLSELMDVQIASTGEGAELDSAEILPRMEDGGAALAQAALVGVKESVLVVPGEATGVDWERTREALRLAVRLNRKVIFGRAAWIEEMRNLLDDLSDEPQESSQAETQKASEDGGAERRVAGRCKRKRKGGRR